MENFYPQLIGFVAFFILILSFQINNRNKIILLKSFSNFFYSIHFYLLNAQTAAVLQFIAIFRNILFKYKIKYKILNHFAWLYLFLFLIIIIGIVTWEGVSSIFSVLGLIFGTLSIWSIKTINIRFLSLIATISWLIHNTIILSYAGIISTIIFIITLLIAIFRFDKKN